MHDPTTPRRRLADILNGGDDSLRHQWDSTEAADDFAPLPAGTYEAHLHSVELFQSKTNQTPGVKLRFDVADGDYAGQAIYHDLWLTPAALPQTKRDSLKLGLDSLEAIENASIAPGRIRCAVRVTLRTADDGTPYNRVRGFDVLRVDDGLEPDMFAPVDTDTADTDTDFPFGSNADDSEGGTDESK